MGHINVEWSNGGSELIMICLKKRQNKTYTYEKVESRHSQKRAQNKSKTTFKKTKQLNVYRYLVISRKNIEITSGIKEFGPMANLLYSTIRAQRSSILGLYFLLNSNKIKAVEMYFPLTIIASCILVASVLAVPAPISSDAVETPKHKKFESKVVLTIGGDSPAEVQESVRKARQIFEDITVDIIQGMCFGIYLRSSRHLI